jgi:hypothetical protein
MRLPVFKTRLIVLVFLLPAGAARGDVGPAFLQDATYPAMRFDNLSDYPDFDFYLKYGHARGNPYAGHLGTVRSGDPFREFEGTGRKTEVYLLAVPHGRKPPPPRNDHAWFTEVPEGCLQSAPLEGTNQEAGALVSYRVRIQDGKLEVTRQSMEWEPGEWVLARPIFSCFSIHVAVVCVIVVWFGVRFLRRRRAVPTP